MKQLSGHGISGGVAAGKLVTLLSAQTGVPRETSRTPDEELQRFAQALREGPVGVGRTPRNGAYTDQRRGSTDL